MSFLEIGASLLGGLFQSDAAGDAADAQAAGTAAATAENKRQYDLTRQDYAPYRTIGTNALRRLGALYGVGDSGGNMSSSGGLSEADIRMLLTPQFTTTNQQPSNPFPFSPREGSVYGEWGELAPVQQSTVNQTGLDAAVRERMAQSQGSSSAPQTYNDGLDAPIEMDPGYQFGLDQGNQALDRKIAAAGGRVSGAALKAAQRFGTDYATTGYNAAYQRRQDRINRLQTLAGIGQTSTNASAQAGDAASSRNAMLYANQGDNAGNARLAQGSIWGNALNQAGAAWGRNSQVNGNQADLQFGNATSNWW